MHGVLHAPNDLLAASASLGQLLDSRGLEEVLASFYALFRIPVRILDEQGTTLGRSHKPSPLNEYLGELPDARQRLGELHQLLRSQEPDDSGEFSHTAFTGATYHVGMIGHDGARVGRFVLGPFITPKVQVAPASLVAADARIDAARARELLLALPRVREDTVKAIARHLAVTLDVLIYAGYRALLSEHMHLSTVQENQRQLSARDEGLLAAERRLLESGRLQAHFLSTALGEIRGPLESIMGQSDALASGGRLESAQGNAVLGIRQRAAQLLDLSNRLLDFSRAESGSLSLRREAIDLPALLVRVAGRLSALAPERSRDLAVSHGPDVPRLWGDGACIEQVLMLLGENALRFAAHGEIGIYAGRHASASADDTDGLVLLGGPPDNVELIVSDRGVGVPDAEKERIFEPFYVAAGTASGETLATGNRLSLAIAKRLIAAHGGSIRVEDNAPRGTRVVVILPVSGPSSS
jgi:signal transduction histidine kinase